MAEGYPGSRAGAVVRALAFHRCAWASGSGDWALSSLNNLIWFDFFLSEYPVGPWWSTSGDNTFTLLLNSPEKPMNLETIGKYSNTAKKKQKNNNNDNGNNRSKFWLTLHEWYIFLRRLFVFLNIGEDDGQCSSTGETDGRFFFKVTRKR